MKQNSDHIIKHSFIFQKLKKQNVVEHVMEQMKELIVSKHLNVGDKIPSELELAEIFGISRTSIREATKIFQFLGVIETRAGRGTYICDRGKISAEALSWSLLLSKTDVHEVLELRKNLEEIGLRKIAHKYKADASSVSHVMESLEREAENIKNACDRNDEEARVQADYVLHGIIIEAGDNSLYTALYQTLAALLKEIFIKSRKHPDSGVGYRVDLWHLDFVKIIGTGNADAMIQVLNDHIDMLVRRF